jgi:hypothetical protein
MNIWDKPMWRAHDAMIAANPYARPYLRDAFVEGWRAGVSGAEAVVIAYGKTERSAYFKGYAAGEAWKAGER